MASQPEAAQVAIFSASDHHTGRGYSHAWKGDATVSAEVGDLTMHQRLIPLLVEGFVQRAPPGADVTSWRY